MLRLRGMVMCAGGMFSLAAATVLAAPPVMDRVPDNAFAVVGMTSAEAMHKDISALLTAVEAPFPMPEVADLLAMGGITEGIETGKSVAIVLYPPKKDPVKEAAKKVGEAAKDAAKKAGDAMGADADDGEDADEDGAGEEPRAVILMPISKYDALLTNFGAKPDAAGGITQIQTPDGEEGFVKDVGGGYAAMSDDRELLASFEAKTGDAPFKAKLGGSGDKIADNASVFVALNMDQVRPHWPELKKEMEKAVKEQAEALPMGEAPNPFENAAAMWFMETLMKESRSVVAGLKPSAKGFGVEVAVGFAEGTMMGDMFKGGGKAGELMSALPAGPYLIAGAYDYSSKEIKKFLKEIAAKSPDQGGSSFMGGMNPKTIDASDGAAFTIGMPKGGLLGGMLTGMVTYIKSSDPTGLVALTKSSMNELNGKAQEGMTFEVKYADKAAKVEDVDVDSWELKITSEAGEDMAQGMAMVFGPSGGPNGYIAKTNSGMYMTMAKSSELMGTALKVGKGGEHLGADKLITQVAGSMPGNRLAEFYIGTRSIADLVLPFAAMAGVTVPADKMPESLPPVAMTLSGEGGSAHFAMFVPTPVIKTVVDIGMAVQQQMEGGGEEPAAAPDGGKGETGQPRF
ncbi:MAG: hypothetical protein IT438_08230 [Phycisphaerales bacterium]|nr:hypothetical protein [Phycisphaerales bacterium]